MKSKTDTIVVLGAGIGGLTTSLLLLQNNFQVILLERSDHLGGLNQPIRKDGYCVDMGQKQFYDRIPEVQSFLKDVLGEGLRVYPYRIGVYYRGKILERERRHRGWSRGMSPWLLAAGVADLVLQRIRYQWQPIETLADQSYQRKGKLFSRIFSQGFDEKLKCRDWSEVPLPKADQLPEIRANLNGGESGQDKWFHPYRGSGGLIDTLTEKIKALGGEIRTRHAVIGLEQEGDRVVSVEVETKGETQRIATDHLVSTAKLEHIANWLGLDHHFEAEEVSFKRSVILVFAFIAGPVPFPHTCLYVTSPDHRIGRITNYGAYDCGMVPEGKSCLAFEIFCTANDALLFAGNEELVEVVKTEFSDGAVLDLRRVEAWEVYKLPLGDPATNWADYRDEPSRKRMYNEVKKLKNVYQVSRTGIDKTIYAGIMAAESIVKEDRKVFLQKTAPEIHRPWL